MTDAPDDSAAFLVARAAALDDREAALNARESDLDDAEARRRRHDALKAADTLNAICGPFLKRYMDEMQRLAALAGHPLHTCIPRSGTTMDISPPSNEDGEDARPILGPLQEIASCPRREGIPYVLLIDGQPGEGGIPCVAEWSGGFEPPGWSLWLGGGYYGAMLEGSRVTGWYDIGFDPAHD